jgi:hypothetical protein
MTQPSALTFLLLANLLVACMTPNQRREDDLLREARSFNDDFRWARWDILGQSMTPEENLLFQERKNLVDDNLVLADYEVTAIRFLQNSEAATVEVSLQWYKKNEPTVRKATLQQRWELRTGRWMMIKQRRVRGDRFPLVPEPTNGNADHGGKGEKAPLPAATPGPA